MNMSVARQLTGVQGACQAGAVRPCITRQPCHVRHPVGLPRQSLPMQAPHALPSGQEDISDALKADMERYKRSAEASNTSTGPVSKEEPSSPFSSFKETVDKVLIADFFLVLFALAWLGVGVVLANSSGTGTSPVLDAWYPLWPTLWQSAIGLLMAGALISGGLGWVAEQQAKSK